MKTKIYGASDDLIEIEGAINDEVGHYDATRLLIKASDGTIARITYDGEWKIVDEAVSHLNLNKVTMFNDSQIVRKQTTTLNLFS
jgi:hypothetical protein